MKKRDVYIVAMSLFVLQLIGTNSAWAIVSGFRSDPLLTVEASEQSRTYIFEDHVMRMLAVHLTSDSTIVITAGEAMPGSFRASQFSFADKYIVDMSNARKGVVVGLKETSRAETLKGELLGPAKLTDCRQVNVCANIFPILAPNDTLYFSEDYKQIKIREFVLSETTKSDWHSLKDSNCPVLNAFVNNNFDSISYKFQDNEARNMKVVFLDDHTLQISNADLRENAVADGQNNFIDTYRVKWKPTGKNRLHFRITKLVSTTRKDNLSNGSLVPPVEGVSCQFKSSSNVLPILTGLDCYFSLDMHLLQIGPFTFSHDCQL